MELEEGLPTREDFAHALANLMGVDMVKELPTIYGPVQEALARMEFAEYAKPEKRFPWDVHWDDPEYSWNDILRLEFHVRDKIEAFPPGRAARDITQVEYFPDYAYYYDGSFNPKKEFCAMVPRPFGGFDMYI